MGKDENAILDVIHKALSKDKDIEKRNKAIVSGVVNGLIALMREKDPLFALLFNRLTYTGSMYENLRIKEANEFDINLVMVLPVRKNEFEITAERPGYVCYRISMDCKKRLVDPMGRPLVQALFKLFTEDLTLQPRFWREWFQSVLDKALKSYTPSFQGGDLELMRTRESGPARTLHLSLPNNNVIDVDLVPVLEHHFDHLPSSLDYLKQYGELLNQNDRKWVMVPKPLEDDDTLWRMNFPDVEKKLLKDTGCMKPIIRLMKCLRDAQGWSLCSYVLKTLVMQHQREKQDKAYWQNANQWEVLIDVLERFRKDLGPSGQGICSFFDDDVNLIADMKEPTRINIAKRLEKILGDLRTTPTKALVYFIQDSPADKENLRGLLDNSPLKSTEASAMSPSSVLGSRNINTNLRKRPCDPCVSLHDSPAIKRASVGSSVVDECSKGTDSIIISLKVDINEMERKGACYSGEVTLRVLADGDFLDEIVCPLHGCHVIEISEDRLQCLMAPSSLVCIQCFQLTDEAALPMPVETVLTVTKNEKQLMRRHSSLTLERFVQQCKHTVPFSQIK